MTAWQIHVAVQQLKADSRASSAVALGTVMTATSDMRWRILEDPSLNAALTSNAKATGLSQQERVAVLRGMIISYYSFIYNIHKLGQIPDDSWSAMRADMHEFFTNKENLERWDKVKKLYQGDFQSFVEHELLQRPE
jgi:hypothetical protein